jgi:hypothetical protein
MIVRAAERALSIYAAIVKHRTDPETRINLARYLDLLFAGGESDPHRLTVYGLAYLRSAELRVRRKI